MKIVNNRLTALVAGIFLFSACQSLSEYEMNPNSPSEGQVPPTLILTSVISNTLGSYRPMVGTYNGWAQYVASISSQQGDIAFQGYLGGEAGFDWYSVLRDVLAMEFEGDRINAPAYRGIANFFKAYCLMDMTMQMGDIPMTDALKGKSENNFTPKYDAQKDVFMNCLSLLDEANTILGDAVIRKVSVGNGDLIYGGNVAGWQKAVNALRIRILINLSKKMDDADLRIKEQFTEILDNPTKYPLFASNDDNMTFKWYDIEGNRYLLFYQLANSDYYRIGNTYYNLIKKYNDPRITVIAERTKAAVAANPDNTDFDVTEYGGVDCNDSYENIYASRDEASIYSRERYCTPTGEPMILLGYPELCFNIAEAINRGWIQGNAEDYYEKGIRASMQFYDISESVISEYLNSSVVAYGGQLEQILNQKYIAFFNNSGWEAFYNIRRTGIPALNIGDNMNNPSGKIPVRWRYPQAEYQTNEANVQEAIKRQFNGTDGVDDLMWILK
ncbi:SusD/RagB family nutrient-binding outer membrane lipoprotein [Bacteroides stercorirosoris]|jgi:hypothetical protein|uniref:SusD/RagB family nutrient-binding outer membrane lipoprotein n=1 Tax=Bacteroides stercorirosoris TaxID=871324 RepID=UPI0023F77DDD|nr:SusD/RagB family nutrient-binding outer membrane lipoprotein [Bacteroides stercorirosoris]